MQLYQLLLYLVIFISLLMAFYITIRGKAWFRIHEKPSKVIGKTIHFKEIECSPNGLLPKSTKIPAALVVIFINSEYRLEFLEPFELNGKIESIAFIKSRYTGCLISGIKEHGTLVVSGHFGSGASFIAQISLAQTEHALENN